MAQCWLGHDGWRDGSARAPHRPGERGGEEGRPGDGLRPQHRQRACQDGHCLDPQRRRPFGLKRRRVTGVPE
eukprot:6319236-Lingulodinium_polyedra.AAC.1